MYEVIYFSRGGNTSKLATAIADELGTRARHVKSVKSMPEEPDIFLGSGLYLLRPSKMVRKFIKNNDFRGKRVAIFGTSTTGFGIENIGMEWLLKRKGADIVGKYHCAGKFRIRIAGKFFSIRGSRPSEKDLIMAREFARSVANECPTLQATEAKSVAPATPQPDASIA